MLKRQTGPDARAEREQIITPEEVGQALVAGEDAQCDALADKIVSDHPDLSGEITK